MADGKDKPKIDAERIAEAAVALAGIMTYGRSAARLGNARRAAVLSKRPGVRASTVKKWTGYERGPYGWGVETKGDASLRPAAAFGALPSGKLGAMAYVHPDVARAYPGVLDSVSVRVVPDADWSAEIAAAEKSLSEWSRGDPASGFYDHGNNLIAVRAQMPGESLSGYIDRADKTLTHELQHMAQERDGIRPPRRHSGYEGYRTDGREVDARNSANRFWLTPEERVEMPRANTQDVKPQDVHLADRGGDINGRHGNFTNFLATDDVPESIFGFPVVQDRNGYTESDLKFFRENPKAAGFYDTGEEADDGTQEANLAGAVRSTLSVLRGASGGSPASRPVVRTEYVPGLKVSPYDVEYMRLAMHLPPGRPVTAGEYAAFLSYQLGGERYGRSKDMQTGRVWVHNPDLVAEMFRNLRGEASLAAFRRAGVTQVSATPYNYASEMEKYAWRNRVFPVTSLYFKTDDPSRFVRISNHHGFVVPASVHGGSAGGVRMDLGPRIARGTEDPHGNVVVLPTLQDLGIGFKFDWQGGDEFKPYLGGPLLETLSGERPPYALPDSAVRLPWETEPATPAVDVHRVEQDAKGGRSARAADGAGKTEKKKGMYEAFAETPGTEVDFVAVANGVPRDTAQKMRAFAASTRIKSHLTKNQNELRRKFAMGEIGLESLPVTTSGMYTAAPVEPSRKERAGGRHKGQIRVVGKATKHSNLGHVSEAKRLAEKKAAGEYVVDYDESDSAETDRIERSAARPGNSSIVLHKPEDFEEEATHLITRPAVPSGLGPDKAAEKAKADFPNVSGDSAYYVLGSRAERIGSQARFKHAVVRMRPDLVSPDGSVPVVKMILDDPAELDRLRKHSEENTEDNRAIKAVLDEYELIKERVEDGVELDPREKEFWDDMRDQEVWNQLVSSGRRKGKNIA